MTDRHVVTAAHCTENKRADQLVVAIGFTKIDAIKDSDNDGVLDVLKDQNKFVMEVEKIIDHPNYIYE